MTRYWHDQDIIKEGTLHRVIYNQNFVARPFAVINKNSGVRLDSCASEKQAQASLIHHDKKMEVQDHDTRRP